MIGTRELIPDLSLENLLILIVIMVFIVGLVEELVFRSILQTRMEEFLGPAGGIFISSLLFGVMHSSYGTPYEMAYTFLVGAFSDTYFIEPEAFPL
ncbi:MAG: CPBP family intramembrane metalloprotease [Methanosarcina barkeri]|nr:CPBP family intramembrane metalloprotease [Methanosarcina sp. ERenArc_MAG2]